jgi:hypothetical protein
VPGNGPARFGGRLDGKGPDPPGPRRPTHPVLASDVWRLDRLKTAMLTSMLKTLGAKHRTTVTKTARKHMAVISTRHGPRRCFEARIERAGRKPLVARFGGIPLKRQHTAVITDQPPAPLTRRKGKQLTERLKAGRCELCQARTQIQVHQVRALADLAPHGKPQPEWAQVMARMRRKTLMVCATCHDTIHNRQPATLA